MGASGWYSSRARVNHDQIKNGILPELYSLLNCVMGRLDAGEKLESWSMRLEREILDCMDDVDVLLGSICDGLNPVHYCDSWSRYEYTLSSETKSWLVVWLDRRWQVLVHTMFDVGELRGAMRRTSTLAASLRAVDDTSNSEELIRSLVGEIRGLSAMLSALPREKDILCALL